jgi:hypothetical protein
VISDCPVGSSCTGGTCVRDGGVPCVTDQNCPFSTYCISGVCTPNGLRSVLHFVIMTITTCAPLL